MFGLQCQKYPNLVKLKLNFKIWKSSTTCIQKLLNKLQPSKKLFGVKWARKKSSLWSKLLKNTVINAQTYQEIFENGKPINNLNFQFKTWRICCQSLPFWKKKASNLDIGMLLMKKLSTKFLMINMILL